MPRPEEPGEEDVEGQRIIEGAADSSGKHMQEIPRGSVLGDDLHSEAQSLSMTKGPRAEKKDKKFGGKWS